MSNFEGNPLDTEMDLSDAGAALLPKETRHKALWRFVSYSLIGVLLFLVPLQWDGQWTIGIGILAMLLKGEIGAYFGGDCACCRCFLRIDDGDGQPVLPNE